MFFKQRIFLNSFVIANGLNTKELRYLLLSYTGYSFGLNVFKQGMKNGNSVLNSVGKSAIFVLIKQGQGMRGRAAPPHPKIYRVPPGVKPRPLLRINDVNPTL